MNNQSDIIQISSFGFYFLSSNFKNNINNWSYENVDKNVFLIILKELDLTKEIVTKINIGINNIADAACTVIASQKTISNTEYYKIFDLSKKEFEKTGKISGHEVLNLNSMQRLWISHYDMEFVTK